MYLSCVESETLSIIYQVRSPSPDVAKLARLDPAGKQNHQVNCNFSSSSSSSSFFVIPIIFFPTVCLVWKVKLFNSLSGLRRVTGRDEAGPSGQTRRDEAGPSGQARPSGILQFFLFFLFFFFLLFLLFFSPTVCLVWKVLVKLVNNLSGLRRVTRHGRGEAGPSGSGGQPTAKTGRFDWPFQSYSRFNCRETGMVGWRVGSRVVFCCCCFFFVLFCCFVLFEARLHVERLEGVLNAYNV